jgi:hypothetical protein
VMKLPAGHPGLEVETGEEDGDDGEEGEGDDGEGEDGDGEGEEDDGEGEGGAEDDGEGEGGAEDGGEGEGGAEDGGINYGGDGVEGQVQVPGFRGQVGSRRYWLASRGKVKHQKRKLKGAGPGDQSASFAVAEGRVVLKNRKKFKIALQNSRVVSSPGGHKKIKIVKYFPKSRKKGDGQPILKAR